MNNITRKMAQSVLLFLMLFGLSSMACAMMKGIYITQPTFEDDKYLSYLIQRSKQAGINSFIVDLERPSSHYQDNVALLKKNHINYIARIIVFPNGGGTPEEVASIAYREKKLKMIEAAMSYGANQIQLDYIRYNTKQPASSQHAQNILKLISWYKERVAKQNIPLQIDVFGISSFGEEKHIGQNIKLFSKSVDVICPMVYPSHFEPYRVHAVTPYKTVYDSLAAIHDQFETKQLPFKLVPYIELSNYRYPLSTQKRLTYIYAQIQAAEAAGADGWYAWSPHNLYDNLFKVLETRNVK